MNINMMINIKKNFKTANIFWYSENFIFLEKSRYIFN